MDDSRGLSRRAALQRLSTWSAAGCAVSLTGTSALAHGLPATFGGISAMLDSVSLAIFEPHLETSFTLDDAAGTTIPLDLIEAKGYEIDPSRLAPGARRDPFSLLFRGPREPLLPQRLYELKHPALGEFVLFLVPIGQDDTGSTYEAIFN